MSAKSSIAVERPPSDAVAFNVRHVARSLSLHPETVRDFLRDGRITGFRIGRRWRVSGEVLAGLLKNGVPLSSKG